MTHLEKLAALSKVAGDQIKRERIMAIALERIADFWPDGLEEPSRDTGNHQEFGGWDVSTFDAAKLAREALKEAGYVVD